MVRDLTGRGRPRRHGNGTDNVPKWNSLYGNTWQGVDDTADDTLVQSLVDKARNEQTQKINNMIGRGQITRDSSSSLLDDLESSLTNYQATLNSKGRTALNTFNDDQRSYLGTTFNTGATPDYTGASGYLESDTYKNQKNDYLKGTLNSTLGANNFDFSSNINNALTSQGNTNTGVDPLFSAAKANKSKKQSQSFSF